ncbi:MAG TPA: alpha/beta hydrolase [Trebonia sp.]|nr:alpha/beta hydrolase [Trebonia sp.]
MTISPLAVGGVEFSLLDTAGPGRPTLLLHGNRDHKETWAPLMARLPGRHIAVDLPGHGGTPLPASPDMADHVRALGTLLDELDFTGGMVIGHSLGGQLAIGLAAQRPDLVTDLVIIASALRHTSSFKPPAAAGNDEMIKHAGPFFFPREGAIPARRAAIAQEVFTAWSSIPWSRHMELNQLARIDVPAAAARVRARTLLLTGQYDKVCPYDPHGAQIHAAIAGCEHRMVPDAGHFLHLEYPELVAGMIAEAAP